MNVEWLIHLANLLFLASYAVRDILWLRVLTVLASMPLLLFFVVGGPSPQWASIAWNLVFLGINVWRVARLLAERAPVVLPADEALLHDVLVPSLLPRQVLALTALARTVQRAPGERLVHASQPLPELFAILEGRVVVEIDGREVSTLDAGSLVGEMSFLTDAHPRADVRATHAVRCLAWDKARLRAHLDAEPDVKAALQRAIGRDLCAKLARPTEPGH